MTGAACPSGKIMHKTAAAARRHMAELIEKDGSIRMNVYECRACGRWHVGHKRGLGVDIAKALAAGSRASAQQRRRRTR